LVCHRLLCVALQALALTTLLLLLVVVAMCNRVLQEHPTCLNLLLL
jgi:hypothetical protein